MIAGAFVRTVLLLMDAGGSDAAALLAVMVPLVGIPVGVLTFLIRSLREQQSTYQTHLTHRVSRIEAGLRRISRRVADYERQHATKEDWLRESMLARRNIERLSEALARMETSVELMSRSSGASAGGRRRRQEVAAGGATDVGRDGET